MQSANLDHGTENIGDSNDRHAASPLSDEELSTGPPNLTRVADSQQIHLASRQTFRCFIHKSWDFVDFYVLDADVQHLGCLLLHELGTTRSTSSYPKECQTLNAAFFVFHVDGERKVDRPGRVPAQFIAARLPALLM